MKGRLLGIIDHGSGFYVPRGIFTPTCEAKASTAQPGVTLSSVPFTQLTVGDVAACAYNPVGVSRYSRSTDGMESILIPAGRARIGDDSSCPSARENEGPSHEVELSTFLMDIEPVSLGAYARFLNSAKPNQDQLFDWCLLPAEDARCCHLPLTLGEDGWQVGTSDK